MLFSTKFKRTAFILNRKYFCKTQNFLSVTFDKFDMSLINKSVNFLKKEKKMVTQYGCTNMH